MTYKVYNGPDNEIGVCRSFKMSDGILRLYPDDHAAHIGRPDAVFAPGHWSHLIREEEA